MCIDIHIYVYICIFAIQFTFVPRKSDMIPLDVYSHDVLKQASPPTPPLRRHISTWTGSWAGRTILTDVSWCRSERRAGLA